MTDLAPSSEDIPKELTISGADLRTVQGVIRHIDDRLLEISGVTRKLAPILDIKVSDDSARYRIESIRNVIPHYTKIVRKIAEDDFAMLTNVCQRYANIMKNIDKFPSLAGKPKPIFYQNSVARARILIDEFEQEAAKLLDSSATIDLEKLRRSFDDYCIHRDNVFNNVGKILEDYEKITWDRIRGWCAVVGIFIACVLFAIEMVIG